MIRINLQEGESMMRIEEAIYIIRAYIFHNTRQKINISLKFPLTGTEEEKFIKALDASLLYFNKRV